jgi:hypothetical protein
MASLKSGVRVTFKGDLVAYLGMYTPYYSPFKFIQHYPPVFRGCPGLPSNENITPEGRHFLDIL